MFNREQLIAAQLREYPDSVIVPEGEESKWLYETPPTANSTWLESLELWKAERPEAASMIDLLIHEHKQVLYYKRQAEVARWMATAYLCHRITTPVFYQCGRREDGTYKWRGARFGVDGPEYFSNFPQSPE